MTEPSKELTQKLLELRTYLRSLKSAVVAFSGGVDSTLLLKIAHEELGTNAMAVTAQSCSFPKRELEEAKAFCKANGIRHVVCQSEELDIPEFRHNPANRCYLCKHELFTKIISIAKENGMAAVCEGSNVDDNSDWRPGLMAIQELGIKSPLRHCNLYKKEIRELSRQLGLPTAEKQSFACLASRFPYGEEINEKKLGMVDKAEQLLLDKGFTQLRVRIHGENLARIEVPPAQMQTLLQNSADITQKFRAIGFSYVTMDLQGYRTGSMNEVLPESQKKIYGNKGDE